MRANLKSIAHRCHLFEVAFVWELTEETIQLPLGCLQGGSAHAVEPYTLRQVRREQQIGKGGTFPMALQAAK